MMKHVLNLHECISMLTIYMEVICCVASVLYGFSLFFFFWFYFNNIHTISINKQKKNKKYTANVKQQWKIYQKNIQPSGSIIINSTREVGIIKNHLQGYIFLCRKPFKKKMLKIVQFLTSVLNLFTKKINKQPVLFCTLKYKLCTLFFSCFLLTFIFFIFALHKCKSYKLKRKQYEYIFAS